MNALLSLAALALASAQNVTLKVESDDTRFDGKGLSGIHFGAALNGVVLVDDLVSYPVNPKNSEVYQQIQDTPYTLHQEFGELIFQAGTSLDNATYVSGDYLAYHDSDSVFYACKSLPYDPYGYTTRGNAYGVQVIEDSVPSDCTPIKIRAE